MRYLLLPPLTRMCHVAPAAGWLYQEADSLQPTDIEFTVVSEAQPTEQQLADLKFAWTAVKHVKVRHTCAGSQHIFLLLSSGIGEADTEHHAGCRRPQTCSSYAQQQLC